MCQQVWQARLADRLMEACRLERHLLVRLQSGRQLCAQTSS